MLSDFPHKERKCYFNRLTRAVGSAHLTHACTEPNTAVALNIEQCSKAQCSKARKHASSPQKLLTLNLCSASYWHSAMIMHVKLAKCWNDVVAIMNVLP